MWRAFANTKEIVLEAADKCFWHFSSDFKEPECLSQFFLFYFSYMFFDINIYSYKRETITHGFPKFIECAKFTICITIYNKAHFHCIFFFTFVNVSLSYVIRKKLILLKLFFIVLQEKLNNYLWQLKASQMYKE